MTRPGVDGLRPVVLQAIDRARPAITGLSRRIHANPELGYQERQASAWVGELLDQYGYQVEAPFAGLPTGLRAVPRDAPGGPTIALLAEYDALPVLGHGCGHNLIAAAAVGAALGLAAVAPRLPGKVIVLGTPAEEGGVEGAGGKAVLLEQGAFQGVDAAVLLHPATRTVVASPSRARAALEMAFRGRAAHASLSPELGASALEGLLLTFSALNSLRQHLDPDVQVHGIITEGGTNPGIIPERAVGRFYVRAPTGDMLREAGERVRRCARASAVATRTRVSFRQFSHTYLEMRPNPVLAEVLEKNLRLRGFSPEAPSSTGGGSTDMGNVSQAVPALHPYFNVGGGITHPAHTRAFARLAGSPAAHRHLLAAVKALAMACLDLLGDPAALPRARRALEQGQELGTSSDISYQGFDQDWWN